MQKIITIVIIAIIGIVAYKAVTKNDIGKSALKKIEKQIDANKKASIGSTIVCPICHTSFEKKMFSSYDFDVENISEGDFCYISEIAKERLAQNLCNDINDCVTKVELDTEVPYKENED